MHCGTVPSSASSLSSRSCATAWPMGQQPHRHSAEWHRSFLDGLSGDKDVEGQSVEAAIRRVRAVQLLDTPQQCGEQRRQGVAPPQSSGPCAANSSRGLLSPKGSGGSFADGGPSCLAEVTDPRQLVKLQVSEHLFHHLPVSGYLTHQAATAPVSPAIPCPSRI